MNYLHILHITFVFISLHTVFISGGIARENSNSRENYIRLIDGKIIGDNSLDDRVNMVLHGKSNLNLFYKMNREESGDTVNTQEAKANLNEFIENHGKSSYAAACGYGMLGVRLRQQGRVLEAELNLKK